MKLVFFFLCLQFSTVLNAQDSARIQQIDSLVHGIRYSTLPVQKDSVIDRFPGMTMKKYLLMITNGKELVRYSQVVTTIHNSDVRVGEETNGSAFYYDKNKLIKVEEFGTKDGKEARLEWYFSNDQCFYYTMKSPKAQDRIALLLTLSAGFQKIAAGGN